MPDTASRLNDEIRALGPWFHNLDIDGISTAPDHFLGDYPRFKWEGFKHVVPDDLSGASVLDIGCNAGFYALEMKRRGAARVVGLEPDPHYLRQARFVSERAGADLDLRPLTVYEVDQLGETFDLVIFMGVLYHLRHPLLALDMVHDHVAADLMLFQTMQRGFPEPAEVSEDYDFDETAHFDAPGYPKLHFIERRYSGDPTNWWVPNAAAAQAMLRSSGFEIVEHPEAEVYLCRRKATRDVDPPL